MAISKIRKTIDKRKKRVRYKVATNLELPRATVFRSLNHIYGQIIDDTTGKTVAAFSSLEMKDAAGSKKEIALKIGKELAKRAQGKGINAVRFDRGSYRYHGRVKALAEGLREGGIAV